MPRAEGLLLRVLFLAIGLSVSLPAFAGGMGGDPFAPVAGTTDKPQPAGPSTLLPEGGSFDPVACSHITKELCGKTNGGLIATATGYVLLSVLLLSIVRGWWNRRGTSTSGVRFVVCMLIAVALASIAVGLDPIRGQDLKCCLANGVFKSEVWLQDMNVGRAALLGAVPTAFLFYVVALISKLAKR